MTCFSVRRQPRRLGFALPFAAAALLILASPTTANAWGVDFDKLTSWLPGVKHDQVCEEIPKPLEESKTPAVLMEEGLQMMQSKRDACEAARRFYEIKRFHPGSKEAKRAPLLYIESLRDAGDYNGAVNEANEYMVKTKSRSEREQAHWQIVLSVKEQMMDSQKSQEWQAYALGLAPGQNVAAPYLMNMSFKTFIERYPKSEHREQAETWLTEARDSMAEQSLDVGLQYLKAREYKAAIGRFSMIAQAGRGTSSFEPALYYLVQSFRGFADQVGSGKISDKRLAELMEAGAGESVSRDDVVEQSLANAQQIEKQMRRELPESPWTQKL